MSRCFRMSVVSYAALCTVQIANAQTTAVGPQVQDEAPVADGTRLEDIVVTARRSAEAVQTVPVAITALSGGYLERQNVNDPTALQQLAPSLTFAQQPSSLSASTVYIRGIGQQEPSSLAEQGVGIYLDGVYLARTAAAVFDLLDLERVEVLRGPQGTLFGRNTIGGAIQIISKKPQDSLQVSGKAAYARFNDWLVRSRVDTGYIGGSTIKMAISGQHREADGFINNVLAPGSQDPGSQNGDSFAIAMQGDFGDLTVNYNFDFDDRWGTPGFFQLVAATDDVRRYYSQSPNNGGSSFQISPERLNNIESLGYQGRYRSHTRIQGHSLTLSYDALPDLTLRSISGYRKFFQDTISSLGGSGDLRGVVLDPVTFAPSIQSVTAYNGNNAPQKQWQFSQELQALGSSGDFSYLGGLYYFYEKASESNQQNVTFVLPGGDAALNFNPLQAFGGTSESMAVFGQVSFRPSALDQKLEITAGARHTDDKKTAYLAGDVNPRLNGRAGFSNLSWLASASYKFTSSVMAYLRVSTGFKSGGINPRASVINTFAPEKVVAYEAGFKGDFFNHLLRTNLAAFLTNYDDLQISQFAAGTGGATSLIVNAGKDQLKGFEAEVVAIPVKGLTFDGSVSHVGTNYKTFLFRDPTTNIVSDVANTALPIYTPKWTWRMGAEYAHQLDIGLLRLRADYSHRSKMYFNALTATTPFNEQIRSRSDENLKARLSLEGVELGGSKVDVGIWGDNLTNQRNIAYGIDFGSLGVAGGIFKKPITYGVDLKFTM